MPVSEPSVNEYKRALNAAAQNNHLPPALPSLSHHIFRELPPFRQTSITEWGACLYAKTGDIKAKSVNGLVTFYSRHPVLDWDWLQRVLPDWVCCPKCGRSFPRDARYWWVRNREKDYLWLDACRDCKCKTERRVRDKKRFTKLAVHD